MAWSGNTKPIIVWFSGMSGAGKTTLANRLYNLMRASGRTTITLDGDVMRSTVSKDLDFSIYDRMENIRRAAEIASMVYKQGISVICSFITPTDDLRKMIKFIVGDSLVHVFLDCSLEECQRRDVKGLYKGAREGTILMMTGINSVFEPCDDADLIIKTDVLTENESIQEVKDFLWRKCNIFFM